MTTVGIGGNGTQISRTSVYTEPKTGRLLTPTLKDGDIFGPGGTLGGNNSQTPSPPQSIQSSDPKLDAFSPDVALEDGDIFGPGGTLGGDGVPVKPLDQTDFATEKLPDTPKLEGKSALATSTGTNTTASSPPTPPSTRPYIWKYQ